MRIRAFATASTASASRRSAGTKISSASPARPSNRWIGIAIPAKSRNIAIAPTHTTTFAAPADFWNLQRFERRTSVVTSAGKMNAKTAAFATKNASP